MESRPRQEVKRRLKSVEGHIRGIMRMVDEDRSCLAVIQQIQAVQGSLKQAQMLLLRQHLEVCLCDLDKQDPDTIQQLQQELLILFDCSH